MVRLNLKKKSSLAVGEASWGGGTDRLRLPLTLPRLLPDQVTGP